MYIIFVSVMFLALYYLSAIGALGYVLTSVAILWLVIQATESLN